MVASEKATCSTVGELALDQSAEEVLILLDSAPCQRSSTWHQMRMALCIRFVVPLALVACVAASISRVVPLPSSNTTSHHLGVIDKFDFPWGGGVGKYLEEGMDGMSALSSNLADQLDAVRGEAAEARAHMHEWTNQVVAKDKSRVLDYVNGLSEAADELQNAEVEFVGLCDTAAQLLRAMGEELERKIVSAESTRTSQDVKDEQDVMSGTIEITMGKLEKIKTHFVHTKTKFRKLADDSAYFSNQVDDQVRQLESQKNSYTGKLAAGALAAQFTCISTGIATASSAGSLAPTMALCGAAIAAEGAAGIYSLLDTFKNSVKRLRACQAQFDDLEHKCDNLGNQAETDQKRLAKVQATAQAEGVLMKISSLGWWKNQVLPKNKELVKQLQAVAGKYS